MEEARRKGRMPRLWPTGMHGGWAAPETLKNTYPVNEAPCANSQKTRLDFSTFANGLSLLNCFRNAIVRYISFLSRQDLQNRLSSLGCLSAAYIFGLGVSGNGLWLNMIGR